MDLIEQVWVSPLIAVIKFFAVLFLYWGRYSSLPHVIITMRSPSPLLISSSDGPFLGGSLHSYGRAQAPRRWQKWSFAVAETKRSNVYLTKAMAPQIDNPSRKEASFEK